MNAQEVLRELSKVIAQKLAPIEITNIELEGPNICVYTSDIGLLVDDKWIIKNLVRNLRKRIVTRPDPRIRKDEEDTIELIKKIVPEEGGITNINFDPNMGEVIIEAEKPGLVIGRHGKTLKQIIEETYWRPRIVRSPPITSKVVLSTRHFFRAESETRKNILGRIGRRIHRTPISENGWIRLIALGGCREVGRSALLLQTKESSVLIDCGVNVGSSLPSTSFPRLDTPEFNIEELDAVIVTHAHLDHCGFVPFLYKYGYEGPVYCTYPTMHLAYLLQTDYVSVAQREGKLLPYTPREIKKSLLHTVPLEYGKVTDVAPDMRLTFHNAGHILGSAIAHLHVGDGLYNLAFLHDYKYLRSRLLDPATIEFPRLEALIIESTYGGPKDNQPPRRDSEKQLVNIVNQTITRGGRVLMPVLAVGRAQELMVVIADYMRRGEMIECPVYIDGMIGEATAIHTTHPECLSRDLRERIFRSDINPFLAEYFVQVSDVHARQDITEGEPAIIMATSGMLTGGPSVEYFKLLCEDPRNSIVFVSYQAEMTLGRKIQKGIKEIPLRRENAKTYAARVEMEVHTIEGFSGHSDRKTTLRYIRTVNPSPERVICVHGEPSKCVSLANAIKKVLRRSEAMAPENLESIRLK